MKKIAFNIITWMKKANIIIKLTWARNRNFLRLNNLGSEILPPRSPTHFLHNLHLILGLYQFEGPVETIFCSMRTTSFETAACSVRE